MKLKTFIVILFGGCFIAATGISSFIPTSEPMSFVLEKAEQHDVVLLGTTHRQQRILQFISKLIPRLHESGITHIGLEISSDQQENLNRFMNTGTGLSNIRIFEGIDCTGYRHLLDMIRKSSLVPVALDLPKSKWRGNYTRDHWMAKRISETFSAARGVKMLVVVGNLHVLKRVEWQVTSIQDQFIRYHLDQLNPNLSMYSVVESINEPIEACDFQKWFGRNSGPVGIETRVFDRKLGLTRTIAAKPMTANEAVDAVIVF